MIALILLNFAISGVIGAEVPLNWNFVTCKKYPSEAPGYNGKEGKCEGVLQEFVHEDQIDHDAHHKPHETAINLKGWDDYTDCKTKTPIEDENKINKEGSPIHMMNTHKMSCKANYGNVNVVSNNTRTGGYESAGEKCYNAHKEFACTAGSSAFQICGVDAKVKFTDSNGKVQTEVNGEKVPKTVKFRTVACRSLCKRFTHTCCSAGFIGRSSKLMNSKDCTGVSPMFYYDSSWISGHVKDCEIFPLHTHTETIERNGGQVALTTRCYDPKCDHKSTADSFCDKKQLLEDKETNKSSASTYMISITSIIIAIFALSI